MKTIMLFVVFFFGFTTSAQEQDEDETEAYLFMDQLSTTISSMQKMTEGKTYKDADGKMFNLSFPESDFQIFFSDSLCDKATIKSAAKDVIEINENIDFSKAVGLMVGDEFKDVVGVRVYFPTGYLKTVVVTDGVQTATKSPDYLEFYCLYRKVDENKKFYFDQMFERVWVLIANQKIDKGYMTEAQAREQYTAFQKGDDTAFRLNYPGSVLALQAQTNIDRKNKEAWELRKNVDVIAALADKYRFKRGLSEYEFENYNPEGSRIFRKSEYDSPSGKYYSSIKGIGNPYPQGPYGASVSNGGIVTQYSYAVFSGKDDETVQNIEKLKAELLASVDEKFHTLNEYKMLTFDVPSAPAKVSLQVLNYGKWNAIVLHFE